MGGGIDAGIGVGRGAELEGSIGRDSPAVTGLAAEGCPTGIGAIAGSLGHHIAVEHCVGAGLVNGYLAGEAVDVGLHIAPAQIGYPTAVPGRHPEGEAHAGQRLHHRGVGGECGVYRQHALTVEGVGECALSYRLALCIGEGNGHLASVFARLDRGDPLRYRREAGLRPQLAAGLVLLVVLGQGAVKREHQGRGYHLGAVVAIGGQGAGLGRYGSRYPVVAPGVAVAFQRPTRRQIDFGLVARIGLEHELVVGHLVGRLDKSRSVIGSPTEVEVGLPGIAGQCHTTQGDIDRLVRSAGNHLLAPGHDGTVVGRHVPVQGIGVEVGKVVPVFHRDGEVVGIGEGRLDVLVHMLDGMEMGMRFAGCVDQTVAAEAAERGYPLGAVVATVAPVPAAVGIDLAERLVYPVPDATALSHRLRLEHLPVVLQTALAVAHGVGILTQDEGAVDVGLGQIGLYLVDAAVHAAIDVGIEVLLGALVLYGAVGLDRFEPAVGVLEVDPVAGLVAQRPDGDRRVVLAPLVHAPRAVHVSLEPGGILGQRSRAVTHAMRLDVGLVDDIESVAVAQVVPIGIVGIVGATHRIDVVLLHQLYIFQHQLLAHGAAAVGELVAVHPLDQDGHPVDAEAALLDFRGLEAHRATGRLDHPSGLVLQIHNQRIEIGMLGTPGTGIGNHLLEAHDAVGRHLAGIAHHQPVVGIVQLVSHRGLFALTDSTHMHGQRQLAIPVGLPVERRHHLVVGNILLRRAVQIDIALDAAQPPHILTLEIRTRTPAIDLDGQHVLARFHTIGHIPLGRGLGVLVVAQQLAVEPHVVERRGPLETEHDATPGPRVGHGEGAAIRAHLVFGVRHQGRIFLEIEHGVVELVRLVHIDGRTVSLTLPVAGHLYLVPVAHVVVGAVEVDRPRVGVAHPVEPPGSVQTHVVGRRLTGLLANSLDIARRIRPHIGMRGQFVQSRGILALPLGLVLLGLHGRCRQASEAEARPYCSLHRFKKV